jgi:glutamine synthetase
LARSPEMILTDDRLPPAATGVRDRLEAMVRDGELRTVEILWPDHWGHARGKRIPAERFLEHAGGDGFAFCDAVLSYGVTGEAQDGTLLTGWETGYPDLHAIPDLESFRVLPWRVGTGLVVCDVVDAEGALVRTAPRTVLRRIVEQLGALGFQARVGVELELHLLDSQGVPLTDGLQCYSLAKLGELDPVLERIFEGLEGVVELEGANTEYGPGQVEVNMAHAAPLHAADDATRLKYCVRELARRGGALATFMAKPFAEHAGNSMHLHVSLWRDGEPAFVSLDRSQSNVMRAAIGGVLRHLPGIVLYGAPTVNSYKRFEPASFAPATQTWGGDNRTVAVRALLESPASARLELRTPGADAQPHWAIAGVLAAILAGIEADADPGEPVTGDGYLQGAPLPATLADGIAAARADHAVVELLGADAVHDLATLATAEWRVFAGSVSQWDRDRYLRTI